MPILMIGVLMLVPLLGGCGTAMHWNAKGKRGPEVVFTKPKADKPKEQDQTEDTETAATENTDEKQEAQATAQNEKPAVKHNQETLKLIEKEFAHLPQEERDQLYQDMKTLDPAMVKLILKTTLNAKRTGQAQSQQKEQKDAQPQTGLAEMTVPEPLPLQNQIPNSYQMNSTQGLGMAQPWQTNQIQSNTPSQLMQANYSPNAPATNAPASLQGSIQPLQGQLPAQPAANQPTNPYGRLQNKAQWNNAVGNQQNYMAQAMHLMAQNPLMQNGGFTGGNSAQSFGQLMQLSGQHPQLSQSSPALQSAPDQQYGHQPHTFANNFADTAATQNIIQHAGGLNANQLNAMIATLESNLAQMSVGQTEAQRLQYTEQHVNLRMMYLIAGQKERALQAIPGLPQADQEFWQQVFWSLTNYFDHAAMPDTMDRASQTIAQLRTAVQRLSEIARLELRNVTFCHKIDSFGNYKRFPKDEFRPGQPVLLYAEVDNYKSETTSNGQYRTVLKSTIEIYRAGPNGGLIKRESFPATEDLCNNRRNDYFHSYEFTIPQQITLGPHVLKLTVEDELSQKLATYSLNFVVK